MLELQVNTKGLQLLVLSFSKSTLSFDKSVTGEPKIFGCLWPPKDKRCMQKRKNKGQKIDGVTLPDSDILALSSGATMVTMESSFKEFTKRKKVTLKRRRRRLLSKTGFLGLCGKPQEIIAGEKIQSHKFHAVLREMLVRHEPKIGEM